MQFMFELILWFIIEIVFWGIMFWTGYAIHFVLTMGKGTRLIIDRKRQRKESRVLITALVGVVFWLGLGVAVIIFY